MKTQIQIPPPGTLPPEWYRFLMDLLAVLKLHKGTFVVPSMTEAERDTMDAEEGMLIYSTTNNALEAYVNSSWVTVQVA